MQHIKIYGIQPKEFQEKVIELNCYVKKEERSPSSQ